MARLSHLTRPALKELLWAELNRGIGSPRKFPEGWLHAGICIPGFKQSGLSLPLILPPVLGRGYVRQYAYCETRLAQPRTGPPRLAVYVGLPRRALFPPPVPNVDKRQRPRIAASKTGSRPESASASVDFTGTSGSSSVGSPCLASWKYFVLKDILSLE